jgi:hypothetical protein
VKIGNLHRKTARVLLTSFLLISLPILGSTSASALTLTASVTGSNGTISPSGALTIASGATQTYTFTPSAGYAVQTITVNGTGIVGTALTTAISTNSYTVTATPATNQTIAVTFAAIDAAPTLGPLFMGAGVLRTDIGYTGALTSKQYSGAAVPDTTNRIMYGEIGKSLWLGTMAAATSSNLGDYTIRLSPTASLNTAGCSIGATTQAGTYTSKSIAYAQVTATTAGSCVVYVTRAAYANASTGYASADSLTWTIQWATRCDAITTATRNDITCHIGQLGPGGGIVFYDAGNAGYSSFQARYLEAPPSGWYGADQPANVTPLYNNNAFYGTTGYRPASQGDPQFKMCVPANLSLTGSTSRNGANDVILGGTAGNAGPAISLSGIDQSLRFGSTIGSGPANDKLYKNSMCAFTQYTPQWELANWKSPTDTQYGLWSVPAYADTLPMAQNAYILDMKPNGGFYMSSTPCFVDYMPGGDSSNCANEVGRSILGTTKTTFAGAQLQQKISASFSDGSFPGAQPTWNTAGSMVTTSWIQPGSAKYTGPYGLHSINYIDAVAYLRPVRAFPFYSTNAKLASATGLSLLGGTSGTNYNLSPTYSNATSDYTATVVTSDATVKVIPQLDDYHATITIDGVAGGDGLPTTVALTAGVAKAIQVVVTAVSGDTQTYTLTVTRPLAAQTTAVTVTNSPAVVPMGGVVATTLTASGGNGSGAFSFATSTANCTVTGTQLTTTLTSGTCSVTATRLGDSSYAVSSASTAVTFAVTTAGIVPTFGTPVSTASGYTVDVTNYDATTTFNVAASAGSVTKGTATGSTLPLTVTGLSNGASSTVTVTTVKTNTTTQSSTVSGSALYSAPVVTASAASVAVGTPVSPIFTPTGLQAGDTITSVTYTYAGTGGTTYTASTTKPTAIGTYSVTPSAAVFNPSSSSTRYVTASYVAGSFQITALSRTISFTTPPSTLAFGSTVTLVAAPTLGTGTISYSIGGSTGCTISGATITPTGATGVCAVTATITSDGTYAAATTSSLSISLIKATRTLTFSSIPTALGYGQTGTALAAVGLGGGSITYSAGASTGCSINSSTGAITVLAGTGTCLISATIAADSTYLSVSTAAASSITISLGTQAALSINSASTKGYANTYTLTSTGGTTAGAVTYAVDSTGNTANCSITGAALTTTGIVGTSCSITATMAGNANYNSVTSSAFTVTIVKSAQAPLVISSSTSKPFSSMLALTTTGGTGGGLISYAVTATRTAGCSITGSAPNFSLITTGAVGSTCGITATSAQTTTYNAISSSQVTITVAANAPTAPRITSVSGENTAATVSFTAPSDFGGASSITSYTVTSSPGGFTCTTSTLSCQVTGLTNGTAYTFTVTATTAGGGTSVASSSSTPVTAVTKASAVSGLRVTTGDSQLTLDWLAPASLGGGTFASYEIYIKLNSAASYDTATASITNPATLTTTLTGLTNGTSYDIKVVTLTSVDSTELVGNAAEARQTPAAPPSAPVSLNAYSADGTSILINWQTPLTDGGSAITSYVVAVTSGGNPLTCTLATVTSTSCSISSLTRGSTLAISVKAVNALMGQGAAATTSYLLPNVPGAPTWGSAVASPTTGTAAKIAVTWTAPANNGTRAITSYTLKTINQATSAVLDTQTVFSTEAEVTVSDLSVNFGYFVMAINEIGNGAWSDTLTATTTLPGAVTFGAVTSSSASNVILNVSVANDGGTAITGFLYSLDGITYTAINSPSTQLSIPGLTAGSTYNLYVKAKNGVGTGAANSISVVVVQAPGGGGGGGSPAPAPAPIISGPTAAEIEAINKAIIDKAYAEKEAADKKAAEEKAAADKLAAEKAAAEKAAADKLAAEKAAADKLAAEKAAAEKAAADKLAAEKAAAEKAAADKLAAEKAAAEKAAADKLAAEKAAADKAAADKLAAEKAAAEKAAADKLAAEKLAAEQLAAEQALATKLAEEKAAAEKLAACILGKTSTLVTSKSKTMKIYNQICFMPQMLKPIDKDLAEINKVISLIKSKKIKQITLLSFADEKIGVDFKSVAKAQAGIVSTIIKKALPNLKVSYKLYGSSAKKNIVSQGRVVITAN